MMLQVSNNLWRTPISGSPRPLQIVENCRLETIADITLLRAAWKKVRANKGGPGGDGVTLEAFGSKLEDNLKRISEALMNGRYRPAGLRRARIAKADGRFRKLAIPSIMDRVAQTSMLLALTPVLDPRMSEVSWGYRPGRGIDGALEQIRHGLESGYSWTLDADISKYFDRVPHKRLIEELTIWADDERIIALVKRWLRSFSWFGRGIPQGAPISPLLANLYLHPIDRLLVVEGYRVIRYADDLVIQAKSEGAAEVAKKALSRLLLGRGLNLNSPKTRIVPPGVKFTFLGQDIDGPEYLAKS